MEAEAPILWPPGVKSLLIGKDPDAGKDWRQEEKGAAEDEMVGWHHQLNGHEFEQTLGDGEGSLACHSPWGRKESDTTEWLNWIELRLQHARIPCSSVSLRVCSNSCPLSQWCYLTISSSAVPFFSCTQSLLASRSFPVSQLSASSGQSLEFQLQHQSFQWIFRTDFL